MGAIDDVLDERRRQQAKYGRQDYEPFLWSAILNEEAGEFAQAAVDSRFGGSNAGVDRMREEAIQVAAVGIAIVECIDRGRWKWGY